MKALAEFGIAACAGEAGIYTKIYPKAHEATQEESDAGREIGKRITSAEALEASGMEETNDLTMGCVQLMKPTIQSAKGIWIIQQVWQANV